ncbi:hypothetical protein MJM59_32440, partial [Salmonella enterica subsp. enterica serovar Montevideo]|nr:hypothetical protein [Salmonella enterica subsp. enterica serovar Montevideo]
SFILTSRFASERHRPAKKCPAALTLTGHVLPLYSRYCQANAFVATSDRPALERVRALFVATTIAEFFRDNGKRVVLLADSLTR